MALLALSALDPNSQIAVFNKKLRMRATLADVWVQQKGLYNADQKDIPNNIWFDVGEANSKVGNSITITMKTPLVGPVIRANTRLTGTEEQPNTKSAKIYRNNYKKAVEVEDYNTRYLDQEPYGLYKEHINGLGLWARQNHGLDIRMANVERYGWNLQAGDTVATCVPEWHPIIYVNGASLTQQPVYSADNATYTNNIVTAMINAGGGTINTTNANTMTFRLINRLALYALDKKTWPLDIGGVQSFLYFVSPEQATLYSDPTWAGSGGGVWITTNQIQNEKIQNWYGLIGVFKSAIGVNIYIICDVKCPTLLPSGTATPYSLTAGYVWPGDEDDRNRTNPNTRDACLLAGKGVQVEWEPEKLHFVKQDDDYYRIMGHGIAGVRGNQLVIFDQENPNATSREYYGSILVICERPTNY